MSSPHEEMEQHKQEVWLDEWGTLLVIIFGLIFVTVLVSWHPSF